MPIYSVVYPNPAVPWHNISIEMSHHPLQNETIYTTGTCYVCPAPGYNKTLCGPPAEYCQESDSCRAKLDKTKFVKGLKVKGWKWFSDVRNYSICINVGLLRYYFQIT